MEDKKVLIVGNPFPEYNKEVKQVLGEPEPTMIVNPYNPEIFYRDDMTKKQREEVAVPVRQGYKIGRNDKCPCNSGLKYKKCCLNKE